MQTDMTQTCALTNLLEEYSPTHCIRFKNNTMMRAKSATFCRKIKKRGQTTFAAFFKKDDTQI